MHERNCFVTLTLRDAPESLDHSLWQRFAKRARRKLGRFRFYMAGEYGELTGRPHFHALLFGVDFHDKEYLGKSPGGSKLYTSDTLSELWGLGHTSVGDVTFESAAYVARYVMKKITGDAAESHYAGRVPEYCRMSNGGRSGERGIGFSWWKRFGRSDVAPDGCVVVNGHKSVAPRYYRKLQREQLPFSARALYLPNRARQLESLKDMGPSRIEAKGKVVEARLGMLRRKI